MEFNPMGYDLEWSHPRTFPAKYGSKWPISFIEDFFNDYLLLNNLSLTSIIDKCINLMKKME